MQSPTPILSAPAMQPPAPTLSASAMQSPATTLSASAMLSAPAIQSSAPMLSDSAMQSPATTLSASVTLSTPQKEAQSARKGRTVSVEGNIGCGKSTFLKHFQKFSNVEVFEEPVDKWKDVMGYNALDLLYKDTQRWSCPFEFLVTLSLIENHRAVQSQSGVKIMERSVYSTRHCFMEYLHNQGHLHAMDHVILTDCHTWLQQHEDVHLDLIVYLRASPEVCAERIRLRSRAEETDIPLDYLRALHELHDDWLLQGKRGELPAPVLVLDADKNMEDLQRDIDAHSQEIMCGHSRS